MSRLGKYSRTFGFIFSAALVTSAMNSAVVNNTGAPSFATYGVTQAMAESILGALTGEQVAAAPMAQEPTGDDTAVAGMATGFFEGS